MIEIVESPEFKAWIRSLRDERAKARITQRLRRLVLGNPGDAQPIGGGVNELRIHYGPGYRVYYIQRGEKLIILLCGGDKSTQVSDISAAKRLAKEYP